jgi:hypothetical protein
VTEKKEVIRETMLLIKNDDNNRVYFFSKAKDSKWFEPLKSNGFFDISTIPQPVKTENGFTLAFWPQQGYLEQLSIQIQNQSIADRKFIQSFLETIRGVTSTQKNFFLGRALFLMMMRVPLAYLQKNDIQQAFSWLLEDDAKDTLLESTAQEGLKLILSKVSDSQEERGLFKDFITNLFSISETKKYPDDDPELVFFSSWTYKEFRTKHFNVEQLVTDRPFVLFDVIEVCEEILINILATEDLDESTHYWRPAIEDHHQNNYHDSAQAIVLGTIGLCASALSLKGSSIPQMSSWQTSEYKSFNRLYIFLASHTSDSATREEAAQRILDLDFSYECLHEIYHFLAKQFDLLSVERQEKILGFIARIESSFSNNDEMKKRQTAWMKLRWLQAISKSSNIRVHDMRAEAMALTNGSIPEHPDFGSYIGPTFVGPTSPRDAKWLSESSPEEILSELLAFKNTDEFASPSVDGFARVLEAWAVADPMKASTLINEFDKLNPQYVSALLDSYSKSWSDNKYVPTKDLLENIKRLICLPDFQGNVSDNSTRMSWVVSSICRFIEAGTRDDSKAFDPSLNNDCLIILKKCLDVCPPDKRYENSADAHSRAINEPRGKVFGALIILTLRRARWPENNPEAHTQAWNDFHSLIAPILRKQDKNEVSLHSHLGAYYRQFQFLAKDWFMTNIDLIAPPPRENPTLWRAFMDGFSYVTNYTQEVYILLKSKGYLLEYFRLAVDSGDKNSRLDRLQNRMLELTLAAYVLGDESIDEGIIATILKEKHPKEWHQLIWALQSIIGGEPEPAHLSKAQELISKLLELKRSDSSGESYKEHFKGLGRFLDFIKDPADNMVAEIIKIVAEDRESPWELGDIIEYLHQFKDSHTRTVGNLFKLILDESNSAPAWPPEKVREISQTLLKNGEIDTMIKVCRIYSERSPTCEPIRDICTEIGKIT